MRIMANYLIIMLTVLLLIFRIVVVFTTTMGIEFSVQSLNVNFEIILLFITVVCIILMTKTKLIGAIIYLVSSLVYYGPDLLNKFIYLSQNTVSMDTATQIIVSIIGVIIPIFAFFILAFAKEQQKRPVNKKTDFFYKNDEYDRKYDDRVDKNNYRIM